MKTDFMPPSDLPPPPASRRPVLLACSLLVLLVGLTFGRVVGHPFLNWDDDIQLVDNPTLNPVTLEGWLSNFTQTRMTVYMPVSYTVWTLVALVSPRADGALEPMWFHALNVALHAGSTLLVFFLLVRLTARVAPSALGAAVFSVHPVQVEPVAWASGMYTVLSGLLSIAALVAYVAHAQRPARDTSRKAYALATAFYVLALLAKASSIVMPFVVGVVAILLLKRTARQTCRDLWPWLVLIVPTVLVARYFEPASHLTGTPLWTRPLIATDAVATYLKLLAWPWPLVVDYTHSPDWVWESGRMYLTWPVTVLIVVVAWMLRKRAPWISAGVGIFLFVVSPFCGLLTANFQTFSTVADRYLYLALLGMAVVVAYALSRTKTTRPAIIVTLLVLILSARSYVQAGVWRDDVTLFTHNLKFFPNSLISNFLLAVHHADQRDTVRAEAYYARAMELNTRHDPAVPYNAGNFYLRQGNFPRAADLYTQAVAWDPTDVQSMSNLAIALTQLGQFDDALASADRALAISPNLFEAHIARGRALQRLDRRAEAVVAFQNALNLRPDSDLAKKALAEVAEPIRQ